MSDWRAELARDGVTAKQKRHIFDILKNSSRFPLLESRGPLRIVVWKQNKLKICKICEKEPKIRKMTTVNGSVSGTNWWSERKMWFNILKSVELIIESSVLSRMKGAKSAVEKGYPSIVTPLTLVVKKEGEKLVAYTSFSDLGKFSFVGNSYTDPDEQGKGYYSQGFVF